MCQGEGRDVVFANGGWHSSLFTSDLWLRKGVFLANSNRASGPGHRTTSGKCPGLLDSAGIFRRAEHDGTEEEVVFP